MPPLSAPLHRPAPADPALVVTQASVTVSSLAPTTSSQTLEHFFSFCGKLSSIDGPTAGKATIHFAKVRPSFLPPPPTLSSSRSTR